MSTFAGLLTEGTSTVCLVVSSDLNHQTVAITNDQKISVSRFNTNTH